MNVCPAIVIVPVRAAPVFAGTLKPTDPLPVPLAPLVTAIQSALLAAVHVQLLLDAVTVTVAVPPADVKACDARSSVNVHGGGGGGAGGAACETVNVLPAAVIVPVRAAPVFAATVNATLPFPAPEAPPVTVIHDAFDAAVHEHVVADAVTAKDPDPPVSPMLWSVGAIENVHGGGGGAA